ncbi:MAG: 16S rRNA (cytidine(1402)-2'-O)-methyltransferase [Chloroherpetonaceae bacterium]|nr:16S rRNA (cytidine(1402)-2'-O)-methyltransferase [Chloroherpetonaceae bacterium]MDW8437768.1 16S rRNA (cytidine(1402)-2'-O)-methyltransferase [Chloroherpetonaceae bacterium]
MSGTLYIVATPIGNLDDITLRALRTLKTVDIIACEDTRQTLKLLRHHALPEKPLVAYHAFNERGATERLLAELSQGKSVALVSDAGTPALSDPGFLLARAAWEKGIRVEPIPGVSALIAAVSVSPIPIRRFYFEGFLPQKKGRQSRLKWLASLGETIALYEAPHRILKLLDELIEHFSNPAVMLARELTKLHEEILVGKASELKAKLAQRKILGEFVVIVDSPKSDSARFEAECLDDDENP